MLSLGLLAEAPAQLSDSQVYSVSFNVKPSNAKVYQVSLQGERHWLGTSNSLLQVEVARAAAQADQASFLFAVPQWFGKEYPNWGQAEGSKDEVDLSRFTLFVGHQQLLKKQIPVDGTSFQLPLPASVALQAWTLAHPYLTLSLLLMPLLVALAVWRGRRWLAQTVAPAGTPALVTEYQLQQKIGEGGMGEVWSARSSDGATFAIKFIKKELAEDPDMTRRLEREIKVCLPLQHRHLLRLYQCGVASDGRVYTVSELLQGETLKRRIASGNFDPPQLAAQLLEQIGDALDYLHQRKLVHRDIKPDNIFVCDNGDMKLMDMGLLRDVEARTKLTHTGQILGTPAYMPPEQMGTAGFAPTADQYAMGIILYEILAGQRPFTQPDPVLMAYQHMHVAPQPPSEHQPRITPEVEAAILTMIKKKPEERFSSMKQVQAALEQLAFTTWRR